MSQLSDASQLGAEERQRLAGMVEQASSRPLTVAIMGQTGVGKSSLLNALFGTSLNVGDVRPTTKLPEPVSVRGATGHPMTFWDMPGIGESDSADAGYLDLYREKLVEADIVLWAIHADTRSTAFDSIALRELVSTASDPEEKQLLIAKISFVLTKVDLLTPPPWIYFREGKSGTFGPSSRIRARMQEKAEFYQEMLVRPFGILGLTETFVPEGFCLVAPGFEHDQFHVRYSGLMTDELCAEFSGKHPRWADVFERLRDNQRVIPCSALFRYNLLPLLISTVNRLGEDAIGRFQRILGNTEVLTSVPVDVATKYGNIVVFDKTKGGVEFDLDTIGLGR
ncbi:GTPase family protein [Cryptosporangium minutisporangium]|uniref:G domain-containing protein n=1 Tax=Cryptosporangium minutisporangium TaxID=113569 RepID=A0ABP6T067_9ACTN